MKLFSVFVEGDPSPGGSKSFYPVKDKTGALVIQDMKVSRGRVYGRPLIRVADDAGHRTKKWRKIVAETVRAAYPGKPLRDLLHVHAIFCLRRPKSHYRTGKYSHLLKPNAPKCPGVVPDLTKLWRSTEDAMKGIVYVDDCQIVSVLLKKEYCDNATPNPGCMICVYTYSEDEQ